ncbi:hypothetical protein THAOC_36335, partial [Thalassiosira oceanica]
KTAQKLSIENKNRNEVWKAREQENPMAPGRMSKDTMVYELWSFKHCRNVGGRRAGRPDDVRPGVRPVDLFRRLAHVRLPLPQHRLRLVRDPHGQRGDRVGGLRVERGRHGGHRGQPAAWEHEDGRADRQRHPGEDGRDGPGGRERLRRVRWGRGRRAGGDRAGEPARTAPRAVPRHGGVGRRDRRGPSEADVGRRRRRRQGTLPGTLLEEVTARRGPGKGALDGDWGSKYNNQPSARAAADIKRRERSISFVEGADSKVVGVREQRGEPKTVEVFYPIAEN